MYTLTIVLPPPLQKNPASSDHKAPPDPGPFFDSLVEEVESQLVEQRGLSLLGRRELGADGVGFASEIRLEGGDELKIRQALGAALEGHVGAVDFCLQASEARPQKLLVADMESTVIENEMLDELAAMIGQGERVATITARAMNGELDFRQALAERVGLLAGMDVDRLNEAQSLIRVDPGAAVLVRTLAAAGFRTALVSGGFMSFAQRVADDLGFDHCQANRLEIVDGKLTGRVVEPILDRDAKVKALESLCEKYDVTPGDAVTIGDGANDLSMLGAAGMGVAYHGKPAVAEAAPQRIDVGDLSILLYYLGFAAKDWRR